MRRWSFVFAPLLSLLIGLASCGGPSGGTGGNVSVSVSPTDVTLAPNEEQTFMAEVQGTTDPGVSWDASAGSIEPSGASATYTAPEEPGTYEVTATSVEAPSASGSAVVTVEALPSSGAAFLEVRPGSLTLTREGQEATLEVRAYDATGTQIGTDDLNIEWRVSDTATVQIQPDTTDASTATVTATTSLGSAIVSAAATGSEVVSNPVGVSIADVKQDVTLVPDQRVAFPFTDVPPGADPATYTPENEIAAWLEVDGTTLRYPVILAGEPPVVGDLLLAQEGTPLMGRVRKVETRDAHTLVQVEQVALDEVFNDYVFTFDSRALETQGVLSAESWMRDPAETQLQPAGTTSPGPGDCEMEGGLEFVHLKPVVKTRVTPILEAAYDLRNDRFMFKIGLTVTSEAGIDADIQAGITGTLSCDIGPAIEYTVPIPAGPLASVLSGGVVVQPKFKATADATFGRRANFEATIISTGTVQGGVDIDRSEREDLSRFDGETTSNIAGFSDSEWGDMSFSLTPGAYMEAEIGVQLGGVVLGKTCSFVRFVPKLGDVCEDARDALFLEVIQGDVGGELQAQWDSPRRVLNNQDSDSHLTTAVIGDWSLENDAFNTLLEWFKFAPLKLDLVRGDIQFFTFYRAFHPDSMTVNSAQYNGSIEQGDTLNVTIGETINLAVTGTYDGAFLPSGDTPLHAGDVWIDTDTPANPSSITATNDDTLAITLPITQQLCDQAGGDPVPLHILGYNRFAGVIPTAGYVGHLNL
ncbi:MAG: hypothetical protein LC667_19780, partial [Thioalkalivibrio sp.]|nr:hypothetical protein [Thioalkalivibrio sp.]